MPCAWGARAGLLRAVRGHAGKFALSTTHAHDVLTAYPYGAPRAALSLLDGLSCYSPCACHAPSACPPASEQAAAPRHRLRARPLLPGLRGGEPAGGHPYLTPLLASYRFLVPHLGLPLLPLDTTSVSVFLQLELY